MSIIKRGEARSFVRTITRQADNEAKGVVSSTLKNTGGEKAIAGSEKDAESGKTTGKKKGKSRKRPYKLINVKKKRANRKEEE